MQFVFSKGIGGYYDGKSIKLLSGNESVDTLLEYSEPNIHRIEEKYRIRLIGKTYRRKTNAILEEIIADNAFSFMPTYNGHIFDITTLEYKTLQHEIISLYENIESFLFPDAMIMDIVHQFCPIFIRTEGNEPEFYMSKDEFVSALEGGVIKAFDKLTKNKIVYLYDLQHLIASLQEFLDTAYISFLSATVENNRIIQDELLEDDTNEESWEYKCVSRLSRKISLFYMQSINHMVSCLDVLAKVVCEIANIPTEEELAGNKYIKFKSGGIYFENIGRYAQTFNQITGAESSVLTKRKKYESLIKTRNELTHNSFLSAGSGTLVGYNTPVVNNQKLRYAVTYLWDIDENGKAIRWNNRSKFYSQERVVEEYILDYMCMLFQDVPTMLHILNEYLSSK